MENIKSKRPTQQHVTARSNRTRTEEHLLNNKHQRKKDQNDKKNNINSIANMTRETKELLEDTDP